MQEHVTNLPSCIAKDLIQGKALESGLISLETLCKHLR